MAARILPFTVFMLSALIAQAFTNSPGVVYPLRALAMAVVLAAFWPIYARFDWRADPVAIGVRWVLIPYAPADTTPPYGTLAGWMVMRGVGTVLLVPIIEELFFHDYLEARLRVWAGPVVAALITAGPCALLHDRGTEVFAAGLVFSWVMHRQGRVGDAILAHGTANLVVFAAAFAMGRMYII